MNLGEAASLARGRLVRGDPAAPVRGVSIDPDQVAAGALFVALEPRPALLARAVARGAHVLAAGPPMVPGRHRGAGGIILVPDPLPALQQLAARHLAANPVPVVGITGSVGKTTTKEMVAAVLGGSYAVHRTHLNQNGQTGVPLTVLRRAPDTEILVLEMGISRPGEMARLLEIASPTVGVLGRLSPVHGANFPSFSALVREKRRLLVGRRGRRPAAAVVHAASLVAVAPLAAPVVSFGIDAPAAVRAADIRLVHHQLPAPVFRLLGLGRPREVRLRQGGRAMVENALAALAVGAVLGIAPADMVAALEGLPLDLPMRQSVRTIAGVTIIDDAYNAAPASMFAALELLREVPAPGQRIAVIGDMLELGRGAAALHRALQLPVEAACDRLLAVGPLARELAKIAAVPSETFADVARLGRRLAALVRPGDVVLFKASRGLHLERAVAILERALKRRAP